MIYSRTKKNHIINKDYLPDKQAVKQTISTIIKEIKENDLYRESMLDLFLAKISKTMRYIYVNKDIHSTIDDPMLFRLCFAYKLKNKLMQRNYHIPDTLNSIFDNFKKNNKLTKEQIDVIKEYFDGIYKIKPLPVSELNDIFCCFYGRFISDTNKVIKENIHEAKYYLNIHPTSHYFLRREIVSVIEGFYNKIHNIPDSLLEYNIKKTIDEINYICLLDIFRNDYYDTDIVKNIFALDIYRNFPKCYNYMISDDTSKLKIITKDHTIYKHLLNIFYYLYDGSVSGEEAINSYICVDYAISI